MNLTLDDIMDLFKIPGLSVAVIDDFEIAWAKGYGVVESGGNEPVTPRTLFQAGSISKPVAAACSLRLVEAGKLNLDEDVNEKLTSWQVPKNEFTKDTKVALRKILSHTAGLSVHGFQGYSTGGPIPTLVQVLDGMPPANSSPVRVESKPGAAWRYSGGGYLVAQQLMIDVEKKKFPEIAQEMLFGKIGMKDSTFEQPLPEHLRAFAASGTMRDGRVVEGKHHVYPEMAAAGLWTTPSDLAKFAIEIALSKEGKSSSPKSKILSQRMTREMLSTQCDRVTDSSFDSDGRQDRMGLGFFLGDDLSPDLFFHLGDDAGFIAGLFMMANSGQGAAIMTNSENGFLIIDYLARRIAEEYEWENRLPLGRFDSAAVIELYVVAKNLGVGDAVNRYWKLKEISPKHRLGEDTLLILGYALAENLNDAALVMKLLVEEFPKYWNAYDSLADIYALSGEKQKAIENYEKSIKINPENQHGINQLKKLKSD